MAKRPRTVVSDDDSDASSISPPETVRARNKRLRASLYDDEDLLDPPLSPSHISDDFSESKPELDEPEVPMTFPVTLRARRRQPSDDEYTESEESEAGESEVAEEYSDGGFVVDSDDNTPRRPKRRGRPRNSRAYRREKREKARARREKRAQRENEDSDDLDSDESDASIAVSDTSIAEELRELNAEKRAPKPRHYRERAPVDYSIPPPPSIEEVAASQPEPKQKARLRRLYDIQGPFGGADAVALFPLKKADLQTVSELDTKVPTSLNNSNSENNVELADVDFSVVGGLDDYISKLKEMISLPLLYPELYERLGITPPRGVLFHGPPGTGKTLMARALAASHKREKVAFYMRKGADILSKWIGESERQLRELFDEARANQPSIIFFDEIDGLAPVRSARQEQHHASIVSTLLALMDGMDNRGQVVVIGATNRPDSVDPALRRPGRFDREFYFPLPNLEARKRILEIHTRKWDPKPDSELLETLASQTKGYGGADLRALTTEAALLAVQHAYPEIYKSSEKLQIDASLAKVSAQDFMLALDRIQPSSSRPAAPAAAPLPPRIAPLLRTSVELALNAVNESLPALHAHKDAQAAVFLSGEQFASSRLVAQFNSGRVHRPRLLFTGSVGSGHALVARAVAAALEGVYVVELGAAALASASLTPPESTIVSTFAELRRRSPSCLLLPDLQEWTGASLTSLLTGLLNSLNPTEQVLVLAAVDLEAENNELSEYFGAQKFNVELNTSKPILSEFFSPIFEFVKREPTACLSAVEVRKLKPAEMSVSHSNAETNAETNAEMNAEMNAEINENAQTNSNDEKQTSKVEGSDTMSKSGSVFSEQDRKELRTRSQLKLKLGVILDGFRARFRRFRKPVIDEGLLAFLFEPATDVEQPYARADDQILDLATGKKYFNMDLETVEDRLWNGYYCEPIQFLEDVEKIYKDAVETGDRDRLHKAAEMLANAQVAVDDISADKEFAKACRILRVKDAATRLREMERAELTNTANLTNTVDTTDTPTIETVIDTTDAATVDTTDTPTVNTVDTPTVDATDATHPTLVTDVPDLSMTDVSPSADSRERSVELHEHIEIPLVPPESYDVPVESLKPEELDSHKIAGLDLRGEFKLDAAQFDALQTEVYDLAASLTLDKLEQLFAQLSNVAWQHRLSWDRSAMVQAMRACKEKM